MLGQIHPFGASSSFPQLNSIVHRDAARTMAQRRMGSSAQPGHSPSLKSTAPTGMDRPVDCKQQRTHRTYRGQREKPLQPREQRSPRECQPGSSLPGAHEHTPDEQPTPAACAIVHPRAFFLTPVKCTTWNLLTQTAFVSSAEDS